jgi:hypothetical protein|nr:MAG TPA: hypothetical protein [Caudoviricetes sp.]DAT94857.1 MAG TPA: hypothetical protein [Caudoviricetes sp.]
MKKYVDGELVETNEELTSIEEHIPLTVEDRIEANSQAIQEIMLTIIEEDNNNV